MLYLYPTGLSLEIGVGGSDCISVRILHLALRRIQERDFVASEDLHESVRFLTLRHGLAFRGFNEGLIVVERLLMFKIGDAQELRRPGRAVLNAMRRIGRRVWHSLQQTPESTSGLRQRQSP